MLATLHLLEPLYLHLPVAVAFVLAAALLSETIAGGLAAAALSVVLGVLPSDMAASRVGGPWRSGDRGQPPPLAGEVASSATAICTAGAVSRRWRACPC